MIIHLSTPVLFCRRHHHRAILHSSKDRICERTLTYDELSLSEIAYKLNYSSVQHLSSQFKKVTGLTPSYFKSIGRNRRPLDRI
ncbi:MAG: AraC family transcriptional regulator [Bacteroidota bacterium]